MEGGATWMKQRAWLHPQRADWLMFSLNVSSKRLFILESEQDKVDQSEHRKWVRDRKSSGTLRRERESTVM